MCLYVLMTTSDLSVSAPNNTIILAVGVVWTCLSSTVGMVAVSARSFVLNIGEKAPPDTYVGSPPLPFRF